MICDFLRTRARLTPNKAAFIEFKSKREISFAELDEGANRLAAFFQNEGIAQGDRVGVLCRNRFEFFETLFACARIGAVLVPFNWRSPVVELIPLWEMVAPKIIFHGIEDEAVAAEIAGDVAKVNYDNGYEEIINTNSPREFRKIWGDDECWYLIFTSGTTGMPKAVIQTYHMAIANAINVGQAIGINGGDSFLNFLPLFHTAGINLHTLPALFNGCTSWVIEGFDAAKVLHLIQEKKINCFFGVPQVYLLMAQHSQFAETDFSHLKSVACGGAPMPDYLIDIYAKRGAFVCNGMGMSETGPTVFLMDKDNVIAKIGSCGKPQIMSMVRIIDENGAPCHANQEGHLLFAGANITPGYWHNEKATQEAFIVDDDGTRWLKSGDLAKFDDDGYYYIVGRSKEMFISGGENVYPIEVENTIHSHPDVIECAVVGYPSEQWGEIGVAFVHAKSAETIKELRAFCRARLAHYKVPKQFVFVTEFPRTAAGKIQKHILKNEYENRN